MDELERLIWLLSASVTAAIIVDLRQPCAKSDMADTRTLLAKVEAHVDAIYGMTDDELIAYAALESRIGSGKEEE